MNLCCFFGEGKYKVASPESNSSQYEGVAARPSSGGSLVGSKRELEAQKPYTGIWPSAAPFQHSSPPKAPRTPEPSCSAAANSPVTGTCTDSVAQCATDSYGSCATSSSGAFSGDSTLGQPQPVEELHNMVHAERERQADSQQANGKGNVSAELTNLPPVQHHSRASQDGPGSSSSRDRGKLGSPIKTPAIAVQQLSLSSLTADPLDGNPNFQVLQALTPGASSSVFLCLDRRDQAKVAIKLVNRGVSNAKAAEREIGNLRLCGLHPYIIHMREVFLTDSHLALVFDYAPGGNLANYIETYQSSKPGRGISEERTRWIFRQIVVAVDFCHSMGIANRDIKLENVLLVPAGDDPTKAPLVKLSDFGFSKDEHADSLCKTACGTPESVAPEILSGELYDGKSSDIWSMGVLFFAMLTGTFPFSRPLDDELDNTAALRKLFLRIAKAQYPRPHHISKAGLSLLDKMLQVNPRDRIDIASMLSHPWFGTSMKDDAMSVNQGLLEMPDSMLTGFAVQSEDEIAQIIQASSRRPHSYSIKAR